MIIRNVEDNVDKEGGKLLMALLSLRGSMDSPGFQDAMKGM